MVSDSSEFLYLHQTRATGNLIHCAYAATREILKKVFLNEELHYEDSSNSGASLLLSDTSKTTGTAVGTRHNGRNEKQEAYGNQVRGLVLYEKFYPL